MTEQCYVCGAPILGDKVIPVRAQVGGKWQSVPLHALEENPACWASWKGWLPK